MTTRQRWRTVLGRQQPDKVPIHDSPWPETIRRWQREGLPAEIPVEDYFGYEMVGFSFDQSPMFEVKTLYKDNEYIIETTPYGGVRKNFRTYASTPEIIDWAVKSKEDWEKIKPRLEPSYTRVDWVSFRYRYQRAISEDKCLAFCAAIGYDHLQSYVRSEDLLIMMLEEPTWFRDMASTVAQLVVSMAQMIMDAGYTFDIAFLFNDMGYRNGPLFSPELYRKCILEYDAMLCDFFHSKGLPVIYHTDGDVHLLIPHLIEAGIDCLQPLEAKAHMDVRKLKEQYGDRIAFMGNIDVMKMADEDPAVIEEEIASKFEVAKVGGGYIYHSDHSVPPSVSFEQYCRVMDLVKKYGQY
ncbi:MAG: uroporphyrinogen decarboxylase family protein [Armatimonadetes bacterium]|nr:uroporphyrinogen decarboxylase family protein [Armatimonadota bacterium]MDW8122889.1 uroporphyrinogen decarboxylase family protein [Armatimonadota bacterium]